jgi:hypothetical protein
MKNNKKKIKDKIINNHSDKENFSLRDFIF